MKRFDCGSFKVFENFSLFVCDENYSIRGKIKDNKDNNIRYIFLLK